MTEEPRKPILHQSGLNMLSRCARQFYYRYREGIRIPPGSAALVGTATHAGGQEDVKAKLTSGEPLPVDAVKAIAADTLEREWDGSGCRLTADELVLGEKAARGEAKDLAVRLAGVYHQHLTPVVNPISVRHMERPFHVILDGFPYDLGGYIDVQERGGVRDLKTSGKKLNQTVADTSLQLTFYSLAVEVLDGAPPDTVVLDAVVKTKEPYTQTLVSRRGPDERDALIQRIEIAAALIEKEIWLPTNPDNWWCSKAWCGYWDMCPFGRAQAAKMSMSIMGEEKEVGDVETERD